MIFHWFSSSPSWGLGLRVLYVLGIFLCLFPGSSGEEFAKVVKIQLAVPFSRGPGCWIGVVLFSLGLMFVGGLSWCLSHGVGVWRHFLDCLFVSIQGSWSLCLFWCLQNHFFGALWGRRSGLLFGDSPRGHASHGASPKACLL